MVRKRAPARPRARRAARTAKSGGRASSGRLDSKALLRIGPHIRALREQKGMTQAALVGNAFTPPLVSMIERGRALPSLTTLIYFARKLRVSVRATLPPDL